MISRSLLLVLLALICLQSFAMAEGENGPKQCCFKFQAVPLSVRLIKSYKETARQCKLPAVIFTIKGNRRVCADPNVQWVKDTMEQIHQRLV